MVIQGRVIDSVVNADRKPPGVGRGRGRGDVGAKPGGRGIGRGQDDGGRGSGGRGRGGVGGKGGNKGMYIFLNHLKRFCSFPFQEILICCLLLLIGRWRPWPWLKLVVTSENAAF